jgi:hypothetical protein
VTDDPETRQIGLAIVLIAAALVALSVFMPKLHCPTIRLTGNRLIEGWDGVVLLTCSVSLILGVPFGWKSKHTVWLIWLAGLTALGVVIYDGTGARLVVEGSPGDAEAVYAEQGVGLILAGLSALAIIGAGLMIRPKRGTPIRTGIDR